MAKKLIIALTISFLVIGSAQANFLVDTGQPANTTGGKELIYSQTLFAQFTLDQKATISAIMGWINVANTGIIQVQIYQDNGGTPGSLVNSQVVTVGTTGVSWVGASSLNWSLNAGTYWVGFWTGMASWPNPLGTMPKPAPSPLAKEGYISIPGTPFVPQDDMDIGVRISGYPMNAMPSVNSLLLEN